MQELKQVILIRKDLKLPKGKMAAQAAHASVEALFSSKEKTVREWRESGMPKIVLGAKDEKELRELILEAKGAGLVAVTIRDAGRTAVEKGTMTAGAIGPEKGGKIDRITGRLKLVS